MRKGFSLITAIFVIVLMATVSIFVLDTAGKITKASSDIYREEQAALLARSYTELAIMVVIDHNRSTANNCIEKIDSNVTGIIPGQIGTGSVNDGSGYSVETRIYYLGNALPCNNAHRLNASASYPISSGTTIVTDYNNTAAADAIAAVIIDVFVRHKSTEHPDIANAPLITYHRRTLQKI